MRDIVTADKKKSFEEIAGQEDNLLHNSNMANLVAANRHVDEQIADAQATIEKMTALRKEISDFAKVESNLLNTTEVSRLYEESQKDIKAKKTRW